MAYRDQPQEIQREIYWLALAQHQRDRWGPIWAEMKTHILSHVHLVTFGRCICRPPTQPDMIFNHHCDECGGMRWLLKVNLDLYHNATHCQTILARNDGIDNTCVYCGGFGGERAYFTSDDSERTIVAVCSCARKKPNLCFMPPSRSPRGRKNITALT